MPSAVVAPTSSTTASTASGSPAAVSSLKSTPSSSSSSTATSSSTGNNQDASRLQSLAKRISSLLTLSEQTRSRFLAILEWTKSAAFYAWIPAILLIGTKRLLYIYILIYLFACVRV